MDIGTTVYGCNNIFNYSVKLLDESLMVNLEAIINSTVGEIVLYPNPNNGNMALAYSIADSDRGVFIIYYMLGQTVEVHLFDGANTQ